MATTKPAEKTRSIDQRFTSLERLVRSGFRQTERRFQRIDRRINIVDLGVRDLRKGMNRSFAAMEGSIDRLATHVDCS